MNYKKGNIKVQTLFYFSYCLCLFSWMFSSVKLVSNISSFILKFALFPLLLIIISQFKRYSKKQFFGIIIIIISFIISYIISGDITLLILFLFIIAAKTINIKKFINTDWKIKISFMLIILSLYKLGLTENYILVRADGSIRNSMGFSHPNVFSSYIFSIFCEYLYSNYEKKKFIKISLVSFLAIFIISYFSDSRASYLSIFLLYIMLLTYRFDRLKIFETKTTKIFFKYFIIVLTLCSIIIGIKYNNGISNIIKLDKILSGRIKFANYFLNNYPITLFGNKLLLVSTMKARITGGTRYILDNSYIKILLQFGIIPLIVFLSCYIKTTKKALNEKNYILAIIFFIYSLIGISENVFFRLYGNIFLLYFSTAIFNNKKITENIEKEYNNEFIKEKPNV